MKLYLAGPEVFLEDARTIGRRKQALCAAYGFTGLFPLPTDEDDGADIPPSAAIFSANVALMREADAILANLTPFRGVGADPGTAFEVGFCFALGKTVAAYSADPSTLTDRTFAVLGRAVDATHLAADGLLVEDFGHFDNLMLAEAVLACGLPIPQPKAAPADPFRDLSVFEHTLAVLAKARTERPAPQADRTSRSLFRS